MENVLSYLSQSFPAILPQNFSSFPTIKTNKLFAKQTNKKKTNNSYVILKQNTFNFQMNNVFSYYTITEIKIIEYREAKNMRKQNKISRRLRFSLDF